jgi:TolB-like protein
MDGNSIAFLGELLVYAGDTERGLAWSDRAKQLNPHHPWWYWYANYFAAYNRRDYRGALGYVLKFNTATHWGAQSATLATCGQLGEQTTGARALKTLLGLRPDFATRVRAEMAKWWDAAAVDLFIDGLRKGGLDVPAQPSAPPPATTPGASSAPDPGAARADEGFWVAVLPFRSASTDADVAALADGLSEAIVSGLSRFSYLRVIARSSTERYAREPADVRTVGQQIGARYVMEGTLRQAGTQLRVAVRLVDATTGAQLWGETYDRAFSRDAIFALQDDLVPRIVSTVADGNGALPRSMGDALRGRAPGDLTPYEAVLRGWGFYTRISPDEHAAVREAIERAVVHANANGDLWALLSVLSLDEYRHGFNPRPASLDRALSAARRAVDLTPSNHFAYYALASVLYFRRDLPASGARPSEPSSSTRWTPTVWRSWDV